MWGNLIYELSQMKAAVGEEWKPLGARRQISGVL
jgi:hypothetical protein